MDMPIKKRHNVRKVWFFDEWKTPLWSGSLMFVCVNASTSYLHQKQSQKLRYLRSRSTNVDHAKQHNNQKLRWTLQKRPISRDHTKPTDTLMSPAVTHSDVSRVLTKVLSLLLHSQTSAKRKKNLRLRRMFRNNLNHFKISFEFFLRFLVFHPHRYMRPYKNKIAERFRNSCSLSIQLLF